MSVAVIGGGISGLVCASRLVQLGLQPTVFDTGRREVGGRCSTRQIKSGGISYLADHSAQYFVATDPRFQRLVDYLLGEGAVRTWNGPVGTTKNRSFKADSGQKFIGARGMQSVAQCLAKPLDVRRPIWVSAVEWDVSSEKWGVYNGSETAGMFDYICVAHNGKCADRLIKTAGIPRIHRLLKTQFGAKLRRPDQTDMQLCSLWVMVAVFPADAVKVPFEGARVEGEAGDTISWVANNTAKLSGEPGGGQCWTIVSSRQFGQKFKCPQEAIPPKREAEVTALLTQAFEKVVGAKHGTLRPSLVKLQLWGAAVPLNVAGGECAFESASQAGICGDWFTAPSIEGASISGMALAERIFTHHSGRASGKHVNCDCGLDVDSFRPVNTAALGDIKGQPTTRAGGGTAGRGTPAKKGTGGAVAGMSSAAVTGTMTRQACEPPQAPNTSNRGTTTALSQHKEQHKEQHNPAFKVHTFVPQSGAQSDSQPAAGLGAELAALLERKAELGGAANKGARGRVNKKIAAIQERMSPEGATGAKEPL
jgi:predicted NAD/FAD-dependent oxidoreductase